MFEGLFGKIYVWSGNPDKGQHDKLFGTDFTLKRNGVVSFQNGTLGQDCYPGDEESSNEGLIKQLTFQAYTFLKDACHRHRHHQKKSDTVLDIHEAGDGWHKKITYQLFRQIVKIPSNEVQGSHENAIGFLIYLKSFQLICSECSHFTNDHLSNVKSSLETERDKISSQNSHTKWQRSIWSGFFIIVATAVYQNFNVSGEANPYTFLYAFTLLINAFWFATGIKVLAPSSSRITVNSYYSLIANAPWFVAFILPAILGIIFLTFGLTSAFNDPAFVETKTFITQKILFLLQ